MNIQLTVRRYGPTVHLTPAGELDLHTKTALDGLQTALDRIDVVACDMQHLTFVDVSGLHGLIDFASRLQARGIAFFAYNWRPEPQRLLDLVDGLDLEIGRERNRVGPTGLLRRSLQDSAAAARATGAARARRDVLRRAVCWSR
ncbi:STAS domain-containing protein [Streptomyces sp. NPDC099050]|uniref:STAS domain-containing protein n=1 Tax=Streptomyces sp. NPDC099050 TaxID=3366100 RepID=UPI00381DCD33